MTTWIIVVVSALLLVLNGAFGLVMLHQSRAAIKTLIYSRMLDISNTAADMLDGDAMAALTAEDEATEAYQKGLDTLRVFQDNIDLRYIYCIYEKGDGEFVFGIDPTEDDPGVFGEPIVYTDALYAASRGTAAVDEAPYQDAWGRFYSAYSPVFDSAGNVACVVAVDFSAQWLDEQMARQSRTVAVSSIVSLLIGALVVLVITGQLRRRFRAIFEEMRGLAGDVEALSSQVTASAGGEGKRRGVAEAPKDQIDSIRDQIRATQSELHEYIAYTNALAYLDAMTGVGNKAAYLDRVNMLKRQIDNRSANFAVAVFDINGLKQINDNRGHEDGDRVIVDAARVIKDVFGAENAYRIGGDEFFVVMDHVDQAELDRRFAAMDAAIAAFNRDKPAGAVVLAVSKGAAVYDPQTDADYRDIFRRADLAMYADKAAYYRRNGDRRRRDDFAGDRRGAAPQA